MYIYIYIHTHVINSELGHDIPNFNKCYSAATSNRLNVDLHSLFSYLVLCEYQKLNDKRMCYDTETLISAISILHQFHKLSVVTKHPN